MESFLNVVVCTVTYNGSVLLKKTLDAVKRQTCAVSRIVVVDNNSTEEHKARLREYQSQFDNIDIVWLEENTGGAGGFYSSIKYAKDIYDPDWFWLMDDDAFPEDNCLEKLLLHSDSLDKIGFLAPVIYGIDNEKYQLYHARKKRGFIYKFNAISNDYKSLKDVEEIDVDAFIGTLISREAVVKCGYPRVEYFIEGDDTDYCYRITRNFNGYLIKDARMNHKDISSLNDINPAEWWKQYYSCRNAILFPQYNLKGVHKTISIMYYVFFAYRNRLEMILDKKYDGYKPFRWRIIRMAILDGIKRKEGPRLLPTEYKQLLSEYEKNKR